MNKHQARQILGEGDPKKQYRIQATRVHPDRGGSDEKMAELTEAYRVLTETPKGKTIHKQWGDIFKSGAHVTESSFQTKLAKALREGCGADVFNVHGHSMQAAGWPDLQVYHPRWTGHLELKVKARPSKLQINRIERLLKRGTAAFFLQLDGRELVLRRADWSEVGRMTWDNKGPSVLDWLIECTQSEAARGGRLWIYG